MWEPECTPDSGYPFFPHQRQTRHAQAILLLRDSNKNGGGGVCGIIHRGEAGETDGERGCKVQSEQRGALAEMNLQRGRPLRGSHTLEQEHWAQRVPRYEEAPATVFNSGKKNNMFY